MARERRVSWDEVTLRARQLLEQHGTGLRYWGIPRGGNYVAAVLAGLGATVTTDGASADLAATTFWTPGGRWTDPSTARNRDGRAVRQGGRGLRRVARLPMGRRA